MTSLDQDLDAVLSETPAETPKLRVVKPEETVSPAASHWDRCAEWLVSGLEGSPFTLNDLARKLQAGTAQFWPGKRAAMVTEVQSVGSDRVMVVLSAGGDMDEIMEMRPGIEAMARLMGCSAAEIEGRKGWEKMLKPHGYEFHTVVLRKVL